MYSRSARRLLAGMGHPDRGTPSGTLPACRLRVLTVVLLLLAGVVTQACGETAAPATVSTQPADEVAAAPTAAAPPATAAPGAPALSVDTRTLVATPLQVPAQFQRGPFARPRELQLVTGFQISVFAADLPGVRTMAVAPNGGLYATLPARGRIVALPDRDGDGVVDSVETVASGLDCPYGMVFHGGGLYVALSGQVVRYAYVPGEWAVGSPEVIVDGLPDSGCQPHHFRGLAIDGAGMLYVSLGSTCNVCIERDGRRGGVMQYRPDGTGERQYATGLRNPVGLTINPATGELWTVVNERDLLGDDIPPDMVTSVQEGAHYGWPFCYQGRDGAWVVDRPRAGAEPVLRRADGSDGAGAGTFGAAGAGVLRRRAVPRGLPGRSVRGLPRLMEPERGHRVQGRPDQVCRRSGAATARLRAWLADRAARPGGCLGPPRRAGGWWRRQPVRHR